MSINEDLSIVTLNKLDIDFLLKIEKIFQLVDNSINIKSLINFVCIMISKW